MRHGADLAAGDLSAVVIAAQPVAAPPLAPFAGLTSSATTQALSVWVESISNKVQPTTVPGSTSSIYLEGARRSVEAAQIIVRANGSALTSVNLTVGDLSDGHGHTLTRSNVTFFREYFIYFTGVVEGGTGQSAGARQFADERSQHRRSTDPIH